ELISTSAFVYQEKLKVLVSSSAAQVGNGGSYDRLTDTIHACRQSSSYVVIDAPRIPFDSAAEMAKLSEMNLLVMQLTVKDIRIARNMLAGFHARGVATEAFIILINRYRKRGAMLTIDDVKHSIAGVPIET